jgi:glycosyltransferase involved in cell wall biosynthesis
MNVVIVNDYGFVNGGASKVAILSAKALALQGVAVHFFCAVGPVEKDLRESGVTVHCLNETPYHSSPPKRALLSGLWDRRAKVELEALLRILPTQDTVVHFHSNQYALSSSVLSPALKRFATVYTCHEYGIACPYASFYDHQLDQICHRTALSMSCLTAHCNRKGYDKKLWTYARQSVQNRIVGLPRRLDEVVFVSDFSRKILEPYLGAEVHRHTISNPVDAELGLKRKLTPESPFLFVGLLTPGKGPVLAAQAAKAAGLTIRFIGDGDEREAVQQANSEAVITGWLTPEEVKTEMLNARAVVLPAKWYETQGLVVQEAAAYGVPAIVSNVTAAQETIVDGENGFIVEARSVEALSAAMKQLAEDETACEMGNAAHAKFWANPPTLANHLKQIIEVYEGALRRG